MSLADSLKPAFDELVAKYKAAIADGSLSVKEACSIGIDAVAAAMKVVADTSATNEEKKAAVLAFWDKFVAEAITPIDLPGPDAILDPIVAQALHVAGDYLFDGVYQLLKKHGIVTAG